MMDEKQSDFEVYIIQKKPPNITPLELQTWAIRRRSNPIKEV